MREDNLPVSQILEEWLKDEKHKTCDWCGLGEFAFYGVTDGLRTEVYRATAENFESIKKAGFKPMHLCEGCGRFLWKGDE